jgi:hypothetical protein
VAVFEEGGDRLGELALARRATRLDDCWVVCVYVYVCVLKCVVNLRSRAVPLASMIATLCVCVCACVCVCVLSVCCKLAFASSGWLQCVCVVKCAVKHKCVVKCVVSFCVVKCEVKLYFIVR